MIDRDCPAKRQKLAKYMRKRNQTESKGFKGTKFKLKEAAAYLVRLSTAVEDGEEGELDGRNQDQAVQGPHGTSLRLLLTK